LNRRHLLCVINSSHTFRLTFFKYHKVSVIMWQQYKYRLCDKNIPIVQCAFLLWHNATDC
jgi:hypothetical protein